MRFYIRNLAEIVNSEKKLNKQFANQMQLITRIIQDIDRENGLRIQQVIQNRLNNV